MEDDRTALRNSSSTESGDFDDQIDDVLPVPSASSEARAGQVDGTMDTVLPTPGAESHAADDATTREEMDVDTTVDDVDDLIDSAPEVRSVAQPRPSPERMEIAGEPVTWEPVDDQPEAIEIGDDDLNPINHDSDFFTSGYEAASQRASESQIPTDRVGEVTPEAQVTHQCTACGAQIGAAPFCPQCGTEQYPHSRFSALFAPLLTWSRPVIIRAILAVTAVMGLISLLANSGASALIIAAAVIPVVLVVRLTMQLQSHTSTGWMQIGMMAFVGLVAGLPLAWFASRMVRRTWFETGVLNFGAAGFGGTFAETAGVAPFAVWLVVGVLLPIVIILGIGAIPAALRMVLNSAPLESTGMLLSGALAAGYVVASGIMFYRPLYAELAPQMTTSQWTLTIFGLAVIRPVVWVFAGAMIGAMVWRYVRTASPASVMIPAIIAVSIPLGFTLISLAVSPAGYWLETILGMIFAIVAVFFYYRFLPVALKNDAELGSENPG